MIWLHALHSAPAPFWLFWVGGRGGEEGGMTMISELLSFLECLAILDSPKKITGTVSPDYPLSSNHPGSMMSYYTKKLFFVLGRSRAVVCQGEGG